MSQISLACTAGGSCVYKTEELDLNAALKLIEILVQVVHREVTTGGSSSSSFVKKRRNFQERPLTKMLL